MKFFNYKTILCYLALVGAQEADSDSTSNLRSAVGPYGWGWNTNQPYLNNFYNYYQNPNIYNTVFGVQNGGFQAAQPPPRLSNPPSLHQFVTDEDRQYMLTLVNNYRSTKGSPAVKLNDKLNRAAQLHSEDQYYSNKMSHHGSDGSNVDQRLDRVGYNWWTYAENVAVGTPTVQDTMRLWIESPPHEANLANKDLQEIGIGRMGGFWTQDFGTSKD